MTLGTRMDKEIRKTSNERSMKSVKVNREDKVFILLSRTSWPISTNWPHCSHFLLFSPYKSLISP